MTVLWDSRSETGPKEGRCGVADILHRVFFVSIYLRTDKKSTKFRAVYLPPSFWVSFKVADPQHDLYDSL